MRVLAVIFGAVFAAVGVVVFSLWIEDRYPGDDPKRAIAPAAQKIITKPIVNGVSRQVSAHVRRRLETAYMYPSLSLEEILRRFSDARLNPTERRLFAYRLAIIDMPERETVKHPPPPGYGAAGAK